MKNKKNVETVKKTKVRRKICRTEINETRALPTSGEKTKPNGKEAQVIPKLVALFSLSDAPAM